MGSSRGRALVHTLPEGLQVKQARGVGEAWGTMPPASQAALSLPCSAHGGKGAASEAGPGQVTILNAG